MVNERGAILASAESAVVQMQWKNFEVIAYLNQMDYQQLDGKLAFEVA
jgi:hypothetical protein